VKWLADIIKVISLLLLPACFAIEVAVAKQLEHRILFGWDISAHSDDKTGAFSHCAAGVPYRSGIYLVFTISRSFSWSMSFSNSAWRLNPGSRYPITYQIDNSPIFTAEAVALTSQLVSVPLTNSSELFELFRRGWILKVRAAGSEFSFSLDNSSKALSAALNCTQRYVMLASRPEPTNPFVAPGSGETNQNSTTAQLEAEAATFTANVLAASGLSDFRLADSISPELKIFHAVWWAKGVVGGTTISEADSLESAVATLLAYASAECKGSFASMKLPSNDANAVRLKTVCEQQDEQPVAQLVNVIKRKKGGVYVFVIFDSSSEDGGAGSLEDAGARLFEAGIRLAN